MASWTGDRVGARTETLCKEVRQKAQRQHTVRGHRGKGEGQVTGGKGGEWTRGGRHADMKERGWVALRRGVRLKRKRGRLEERGNTG